MNYTKLAFGLIVLSTLSGCSWFEQPPTTPDIISVSLNNDMTADEVATVLLNEVDVLGAVFAVRPQTVQFNDHLDEQLDLERLDEEDSSEFFVSRAWWDEMTGETAIHNAITKYVSTDVAQAQIIALAGGREQIQPAVAVGDSQVVYDDGDSGVTYRFTMGVYGVRVSADTLTTATNLAQLQAGKLADIGHAPNVELSSNDAVQHLPATVTGGTLLGTGSVTAEEWLGTTYNLESDTIPGFVTGGLRRWQITDRPAEIVEVTVLEMETADAATSFAEDLLPSSDVDLELELPASIADQADAVDNTDLFELQAGIGNYFIDITIMAPFGQIDVEAAQADLVAMSEAVIAEFKE